MSLLLPLHCTSVPQTAPKGRCSPCSPHQPPEVGSCRIWGAVPAPTPPRWLPWKPAWFPQQTSRLHSPPPRRWGLTHIHPRTGHRLGDADRPRRRDHERLACSATRAGGVQGSEQAKSLGDTPVAPSKVHKGHKVGTCSRDLSGMGHDGSVGAPSALKFGHPKRKAPS